MVYLVPRLSPEHRAAFYQYHAALGGSTFVLAITTMLAGLQVRANGPGPRPGHILEGLLAVDSVIPCAEH